LDSTQPADGRGDNTQEERADHHVVHGDLISLEAVVSLLVKKGVLTTAELYDEEAQIRAEKEKAPPSYVVAIPGESDSSRQQNGSSHRGHRHHRHGWLKRKMSKRRWTRRLGTRLFGWQWKKVKRQRHHHAESRLADVED